MGPVRAEINSGGEEEAGHFACCFALCDVGLGKNVPEMKRALKRD